MCVCEHVCVMCCNVVQCPSPCVAGVVNAVCCCSVAVCSTWYNVVQCTVECGALYFTVCCRCRERRSLSHYKKSPGQDAWRYTLLQCVAACCTCSELQGIGRGMWQYAVVFCSVVNAEVSRNTN
mmetsp:Transcript_12582/g.19940  ORF Transcript_12582/g.19940 Transcript_12582/m.19940 type:complete len:124 (+) Transcript_12582:362-733(+)